MTKMLKNLVKIAEVSHNFPSKPKISQKSARAYPVQTDIPLCNSERKDLSNTSTKSHFFGVAARLFGRQQRFKVAFGGP